MSDLLKELKLLLRITETDEDTLLKKLLENAVEWIEIECNLPEIDLDDDLPRGLKSLIIDMVIFRYTVLGKEGITSENIVELSYSYGVDYPDYILRRLKRFRKLRIH